MGPENNNLLSIWIKFFFTPESILIFQKTICNILSNFVSQENVSWFKNVYVYCKSSSKTE